MTEVTSSRSETQPVKWWHRSLGWWLLAIGFAIGTMSCLYPWRWFRYYVDNGAVLHGYSGPPPPFETPDASLWLLAAGAGAGLLLLFIGYSVIAIWRSGLPGSRRTTATATVVAVGFLIGSFAAFEAAFALYQ